VLKFFRKYNKWILGVGGSLLMVVFLIQPVMSMFQADRMGIAVATIEGGEITRRDMQSAEAELNVLRHFGLFLDRDPYERDTNSDPMRWALILKDAQRLGLSASKSEVVLLLRDLGQSDADVEMIASRFGATPAYVHQAVRHWLVVQQYKELLAGQSHLSGLDRARLMRGALRDPQAYLFYEAVSYGTSRLSKPLVEHFLQDQGAQVSGRVVLVQADHYQADVPEPTDAQVQALYEQFKDALPGRGDPYGFGYRIPDRVKIEYLSISMDQARRRVKVTEADALAFYRQNPDRYAATDKGDTAEPRPYEEVRDEVIRDVTDRRAFELVEKMAKAAYGLFYEDTRGMAKEDDYRVVGDVTRLKSMREVADRLEADYGLLPEIHSETASWIDADDLADLPGIGTSTLADNPRVDFRSFVLSARELEPSKENPLLPRRLQVGLAGSPMMGQDRSRYIFRLTDAQPTRQPGSLDEVRDRVTRDTRLLSAYKKLLAESQSWREQAVREGLDAVAVRANTSVVTLPPTSRRVRLPNGMLVTPYLPGIGQSDTFIKAFFNTADRARQSGDVADAPAEALIGTVGVDARLALAVFRVDGYEPLTREGYLAASVDPRIPFAIDTTVLAPARAENPLSLKALKHRLGYDDGRDEDKPAEDDAQGEGA
jgi:SurA-like N-terminal domain